MKRTYYLSKLFLTIGIGAIILLLLIFLEITSAYADNMDSYIFDKSIQNGSLTEINSDESAIYNSSNKVTVFSTDDGSLDFHQINAFCVIGGETIFEPESNHRGYYDYSDDKPYVLSNIWLSYNQTWSEWLWAYSFSLNYTLDTWDWDLDGSDFTVHWDIWAKDPSGNEHVLENNICTFTDSWDGEDSVDLFDDDEDKYINWIKNITKEDNVFNTIVSGKCTFTLTKIECDTK